jgi:uncharacterized protein YndB with AHSA1/START domain
MARYYQSTHSTLLPAPPERVYESLTDWPVRAGWRRGVRIRWEGEPRAFQGQSVSFRVKGPFFSSSFRLRVTGTEPPRRLYWEYAGKPLRGRGALEIFPEGEGSRLCFHWMKVEPEGLGARLFFRLGLGQALHRAGTLKTFRMLKAHLEGKAEPSRTV